MDANIKMEKAGGGNLQITVTEPLNVTLDVLTTVTGKLTNEAIADMAMDAYVKAVRPKLLDALHEVLGEVEEVSEPIDTAKDEVVG